MLMQSRSPPYLNIWEGIQTPCASSGSSPEMTSLGFQGFDLLDEGENLRLALEDFLVLGIQVC